jgi:hypothetical protein
MIQQKIDILPFLNAMAENYFNVIPEQYKKYCILNAQICQEVLRHFNIASFFLPTQLWCVDDERNYVVGFVGNEPQPGIWDGHAICATNDYIFDASTVHLRNEYGLDVPDVVVGERFKIPSHAIARRNLAGSMRLWWHDAPAVTQRHPVLEDFELVKSLAGDLINYLERGHLGEHAPVFSASQIQGFRAASD